MTTITNGLSDFWNFKVILEREATVRSALKFKLFYRRFLAVARCDLITKVLDFVLEIGLFEEQFTAVSDLYMKNDDVFLSWFI